AGRGEVGFNGDGPALEVNLTYPSAIAFDSRDRLFIVDGQAHRIRMYDPETKLITTIAGTWSKDDDDRDSPLIAKNLVVLSGDAIGIDFSDDHGWLRPECSPDGMDMSVYRDDGKPGAEVRFHDPVALTVDAHDDVYVADKGSNRIRKIEMKTGIVTTVAGVCFYGYDGDGKPATQAMLNAPEAVHFDSFGHMYISDAMNQNGFLYICERGENKIRRLKLY